jgi:hypothetical protein
VEKFAQLGFACGAEAGETISVEPALALVG